MSRVSSSYLGRLKESTLASQPWAGTPEHNRNWNHDRSQAAKQSTSPLDPHALKHLLGKERKPCGDGGAKHYVGGNCRGSPAAQLGQTSSRYILGRNQGTLQRQVSVDDVVEARQKNAYESKSNSHACCGGYGPVNAGGEPGPAEPRSQGIAVSVPVLEKSPSGHGPTRICLR